MPLSSFKLSTRNVTVLRDFSAYSSVNIASLLLLLGTGVLLRRHLGPTLAGIWTFLELIPIYAAYAHLGVHNAAERELPYLLGARRLEEFERIKVTLFWFTCGLGTVVAVGLVIFSLLFRTGLSSEMFVGLVAFAAVIWTQMLGNFYQILFRARMRFVELSVRQGIANSLKAAFVVVGGYSAGIYGVYAGLVAAGITQLLLFHAARGESFPREFDWQVLGPLFRDGLAMAAGALAFDTLRTADKLVISAAFGKLDDLGIYSIAALVCQGLFYLPNAFSIVMYPRFQERYGATNDPLTLRKFVEVPLVVLAHGLIVLIALSYSVVPPLVYRYMPDYQATVEPLRVLVIGTYFIGLTHLSAQFILTIRKQSHALAIVLPSLVVALVGGWIGSRRGLSGVALGVSIGWFVQFAASNGFAFAHLGPIRDAVNVVARITAMGLICWVGLAMLDRWLPGATWGTVIARALLAAVAVSPLMWGAMKKMRTGLPMET